MGSTKETLNEVQFLVLANFRSALRRFLAFSEAATSDFGLTSQQYQALLVIKTYAERTIQIGHLAREMILKHHSAVQLVDRLVAAGLVQRIPSEADRRAVCIRLTALGSNRLNRLAAIHFREVVRYQAELAAMAGMAAQMKLTHQA